MIKTKVKNNNLALKEPKQQQKKKLDNEHQRIASLSDLEMAVLSALFVDNPPECQPIPDSPSTIDSSSDCSSCNVFSDEMLFSVPANGIDKDNSSKSQKEAAMPSLLGLWHAHEEKVNASSPPVRKTSERPWMMNELPLLEANNYNWEATTALVANNTDPAHDIDSDSDVETTDAELGADGSIRSDEEVRHEKSTRPETDGESSWGEDEVCPEHYDAWEVLNDEYAGDFGFEYGDNVQQEQHCLNRDIEDDDEDAQPIFRILGTSAGDKAAQPHVLSPPLMEALLNFVPDSLAIDNFWLKYSLVRDGSSLETLRHYVRASPNTILAIETTKGQVFGAFTSSPWSKHRRFYGSGPAFLWKMRHNRRTTPCYSLFEQAQMESEIDVFTYSGQNDLVQFCNDDMIALGGGKLEPTDSNISGFCNDNSFDLLHGNDKHLGFGIALNDDLASGTSSPCGTFRNPSLCSHSASGEVFEVANLEVWTFTPCFDVDSAEHLEMSKYFISETLDHSDGDAGSVASYDSAKFRSQDLFQKDFYRRIGQTDENAAIRDRWHQNYVYSKTAF